MPEVPLHRLDEGIRLCKKHTEQLIDSADVLVQNEKFLSSIPFSILAMEHFGYLLMLKQFKDAEKSITKTQWEKRITHHPTKLKFAYETSHPEYRKNRMRIWNLLDIPEEIFSGLALSTKWYEVAFTKTNSTKQNYNLSNIDLNSNNFQVGISDFNFSKLKKNQDMNLQLDYGSLIEPKLKEEAKPKESDLKRLISFDFIKQDVFYLNYIDDWFSIHEKLTKNEQKALSVVFLVSIKYDFWNYQLSLFYPHLDTKIRPSIKRHPIYQKMMSIQNKADLEEFKKHTKTVKEIISRHYETRVKQKK